MIRCFLMVAVLFFTGGVSAQEPSLSADLSYQESARLLDDRGLLDMYAQKYADLDQESAIRFLSDESLSPHQLASAVKVFREKYLAGLSAEDKTRVNEILWKRFNESNSAFVQVEAMYALLELDRYQYFRSLVPAMIQKLDHYNETINEMSFEYLNKIIEKQPERAREAQVVFNTFRKILFLSRNRLTDLREPTPRLAQKLKLLRWSIKVLGAKDLDKLPKEVINFL